MGNTEALVFNDIRFDVVDRDGQPWIKASQLAAALGYKREDQVSRIYRNNADEFTESMTQVIEISAEHRIGVLDRQTNGRMRIFSLRGCHLLAMFARTPIAKAFRVWVLDVLDTLNRKERPALRHVIDKDISQLRRVCNDFHLASDRLFNMFINDDLIQSLNISANLSNHALLRRFEELAARK